MQKNNKVYWKKIDNSKKKYYCNFTPTENGSQTHNYTRLS